MCRASCGRCLRPSVRPSVCLYPEITAASAAEGSERANSRPSAFQLLIFSLCAADGTIVLQTNANTSSSEGICSLQGLLTSSVLCFNVLTFKEAVWASAALRSGLSLSSPSVWTPSYPEAAGLIAICCPVASNSPPSLPPPSICDKSYVLASALPHQRHVDMDGRVPSIQQSPDYNNKLRHKLKNMFLHQKMINYNIIIINSYFIWLSHTFVWIFKQFTTCCCIIILICIVRYPSMLWATTHLPK